mmetsp:Transcript_104754/g.208136  ORF Transcript_104754/g.208136 Transcript_104754/m.208136 type:complete len:264 (-) Transcript_104754:58-849(-)
MPGGGSRNESSGSCGTNNDGLCGSTRRGMCQQRDEESELTPIYVGSGGNYEQVTTYKYVGRGGGEYQISRSRCQSSSPWICIVVYLGMTAVALPFSTFRWPSPADDDAPPRAARRHGRFDCSTHGNRSDSWPEAQRAWCCRRKVVVGCDAVQNVPPPDDEPSFNCLANIANWRGDWTPEKQDWCCQHKGLGCRAQPARHRRDGVSLNCDSSAPNSTSAWSGRQRLLCCLQANRGCPEVFRQTVVMPSISTTTPQARNATVLAA